MVRRRIAGHVTHARFMALVSATEPRFPELRIHSGLAHAHPGNILRILNRSHSAFQDDTDRPEENHDTASASTQHFGRNDNRAVTTARRRPHCPRSRLGRLRSRTPRGGPTAVTCSGARASFSSAANEHGRHSAWTRASLRLGSGWRSWDCRLRA
jgi:hypothetical protein